MPCPSDVARHQSAQHQTRHRGGARGWGAHGMPPSAGAGRREREPREHAEGVMGRARAVAAPAARGRERAARRGVTPPREARRARASQIAAETRALFSAARTFAERGAPRTRARVARGAVHARARRFPSAVDAQREPLRRRRLLRCGGALRPVCAPAPARHRRHREQRRRGLARRLRARGGGEGQLRSPAQGVPCARGRASDGWDF
mmetsp:Transcript_7206/g.23914  ORF Transcript_7206/g.23914 Transcript_7206/m.23914 type:complete len:206 (-) Transcript_7206:464-1081(-)